MKIVEILLISLGLAMDACAVSVCKGLSMKKMSWKKAVIIGIYFGIFQAIMPLIGYLLGTTFESFVTQIDHWVTLILLCFIGGKMLKDALGEEGEGHNDDIGFKSMIVLAIATSIDALAIGITFAFLRVNILFATVSIGIVTFILSLLGVKIGNRFGAKYEKKTEILGGIILIAIGFKILFEHLEII